jgi:hypothetical protein
MSLKEEIAVLQQRLTTAQAIRDARKLSGPAEQYMEAYCTVEALEKQLDDRLRVAAADNS